MYRVKLKPGLTEAELDVLLRDQIVLQPVQELMKYQLIETDEDNYRYSVAWHVLSACTVLFSSQTAQHVATAAPSIARSATDNNLLACTGVPCSQPTTCMSYVRRLCCSLAAAPAGKLMAAHFLKLKTMAAIVQLGERPNVPSLLRVICAAEEFKNTGLRR